MVHTKWHMLQIKYLLLLWCLIGMLGFGNPLTSFAEDCVFTNPILKAGQDPSVIFHAGYYYLVQSNGGKITIAKSATITGLGSAQAVSVFNPPPNEDYSYDMWAPELFYYDDNWYIYIAATSARGANETHRMFVLQADTADPQGTWTIKGKITDPTDKWAIDGIVFEYDGTLYTIWSGWQTDIGDFPQNLYITPMSDPVTLDGERILLSEPVEHWERSVAAIQEGPEAFIHDEQLSIVYSADASWSRAYKLGLLKLVGEDPLNPDHWEKIGPIFKEYSDDIGAVYGPGHNSTPVLSPDGSEDWWFYHVKTKGNDGWEDRAIFAQRFTWNDDGTPNFGQPVPSETALELPSGEPCGLVATYQQILESAIDPPIDEQGHIVLQDEFVDTGIAWLNTQGSFSVFASVQLAQTDIPMAIISQDGGVISNFALDYNGEVFAMTHYSPLGDRFASAVGDVKPEAGKWYDLVGIYDHSVKELRLYIDGELVGQQSVEHDIWNAVGTTIIGGARERTLRVRLFSGVIKDIKLYIGVLTEAKIE